LPRIGDGDEHAPRGLSDPKPVRSYANDNRALAAKFSQWLEVQNYALNTRRTYDTLIADFCRFIDLAA